MNKLVIVPTPENAAAGRNVSFQLAKIAPQIDAENLRLLLGQVGRSALHEYAVGDDCLWILWARKGAQIATAYISDAELAQRYSQLRCDGDRGLIADALSHGQLVDEEAPDLDTATWSNLEQNLGARIEQVTALPVQAFGENVAVLTALRLPGREAVIQDLLVDAKALVDRLIEDALLRMAFGLDEQ